MIELDRTIQRAADSELTALQAFPIDPMSQQTAVAELGQAALGGLAVDDVFDLAIDLIRQVLDVEHVEILNETGPGEPPLDNGAVGGMRATIPDGDRSFGVLGVRAGADRRFTTDDEDFLRSMAYVIGGTVQSDRARQQIERHSTAQEQRLRHQIALSTCAQALLSATGDTRLELAIEALLNATQANYIFVERNVIDPDLGFCSKSIVEIEQSNPSRTEPTSEYWDLVPWRRMPNSRYRLERGEPFIFHPEELDGVEFDLYAASPIPIKSELDIPIFTEGEWSGLIAFADKTALREWTEEDLSLLKTAAAMIGAFWEREIARERLEQVIRSKDDFLASVSHELRTPLTAVLGFGQILQDEAGTLSEAERSELLETIVRQAADLTDIVNDLLVAARSDTGTLHITLVPVTLRAQASQALEAFEQEQVGHVTLTGDFLRGVGDPHRVRQIIRNLISNALRYGGPDVRIDVVSSAGAAKVLVCDIGPPIPEKDRDRIFEQYQRAHDVPGLGESLGLGLAISRQLANRMGGDLTYRHENGESIFELALPRAD